MTGLERTEHVIDEKGVCMEKYYDSQGRLESTTSDQRVTKTYSYTDEGVQYLSEIMTLVMVQNYDEYGRPTSTTFHNPVIDTLNIYDDENDIIKHINNGHMSVYIKGEFVTRRPVEVIRETNGLTNRIIGYAEIKS